MIVDVFIYSAVTGTGSNCVTALKDHQTNRLGTDENQSAELHVTNAPMDDNSDDDYSQISLKSRENNAKQTSYEDLDQKAIAEILTQQPSVYDVLKITAQNTNG
jgi:hypothetical protein